MTKHHWRESTKSLFASHIDPEKDEQLKGTKIEIENKVTKILQLFQEEDQDEKDGNPEGNSKKESELVELIEDFYKQYQSLFELYYNLRGELRKKVHGRKEEGSSSSTSSSESDSDHSSKETGSKNDKLKSELQKVIDSINQELETANSEVADLKHKLTSTSEEKDALNLKYMAALRKKQEADKIMQKVVDESSQLKQKLGERERELSSLAEAHEVREKEASAQVKELVAQVTRSELELDSLCTQKRELEEQIESKATEAEQLGEENSALQARILELEMISKEKGYELSALVMKFEDNENESLSKTTKIGDLMAQVNNLQLDVNSLQDQKGELEEQMVHHSSEASSQVEGLIDQVNVMQKRLESLQSQKTESDRKTQEISEALIQIGNLKEEIASKTANQQRMQEENEGLTARVNDLELEVESLRNQKSELEEHIRSKNHETDKLRKEKEGLQDRNFELERTLTKRGDEFSAVQENFKGRMNDACDRIMNLAGQVNNLLVELDTLQTEKKQLEFQKQESLQSLTHMENQNIKLTSKIADQQTTLREREDAINRLSEEYKRVKGCFQDSKLNLHVAERKMEEMREEFRMNIEDNLRLLSQRIRVAEQLHSENKDCYRATKEWFEQEHAALKERITEYSGIIATNEAELCNVKEISKTANNMLTGLDSVARKFEEDNGNFLNRISKISNELGFAKNWVMETNKEREQLREGVGYLNLLLEDKKEEELVLREKVRKLEVKVSKEAVEKLSLVKAVSQLEKKLGEAERIMKEKEERMLGLGEEKREAIRQLCVWIDYHRSRCDYLKEMLSKMTVKGPRTP